MKNNYETVFILTPVLSESQVKETVQKFKNLLEGEKAEMVHEEDWGLRKLAYPIDKKSTGFYHLFEYTAEPEVVEKIELELRRDERIIRFLTTKMDKHAVAYSQKKRNKKEKQSEDK